MHALSFQNTTDLKADFAPISLTTRTPKGMRELSMEEIDHASGGIWMRTVRWARNAIGAGEFYNTVREMGGSLGGGIDSWSRRHGDMMSQAFAAGDTASSWKY